MEALQREVLMKLVNGQPLYADEWPMPETLTAYRKICTILGEPVRESFEVKTHRAYSPRKGVTEGSFPNPHKTPLT